MPWIIDKDYYAEAGTKPGTNANAVGVRSRGYKNDANLEHKFRMLTDDREVVYEGRSDNNSSFAPLDAFGMPNAGCTIIQYYGQYGWQDL